MHSIQTPSGLKIVGIGEATVIAVRTSAQQGAHEVRINHPDLGLTNYITYVANAGMYRAPRVGDICYVFCNENFYQYPVAWGHKISPQLAAALVGGRADNITVIYSSGATNNSITHKIELDDGQNNGIRVTTESGHQVNMRNDGDITVTHKDGAQIQMSGSEITLSAGGSTLVISAAGVVSTSADGSTLEVGATIEGKAADSLSKFDDVTVSQHRHIGNLGYPTTSPLKGT